MKPLKTFGEYLKEGTAKKQSPDKLRARSLITESESSYKILLAFMGKCVLMTITLTMLSRTRTT